MALALAAGGLFGGRALLLQHRAQAGGKPMAVDIPRGTTLRQAAYILSKKGIVDHPRLWVAAARLHDWQYHPSVKAGEYQLSPSMTYRAIVEVLIQGRVSRRAVLIPEGFTLAQIIERLAAKRVCDAEAAAALASDPEFIASLGIKAASLEGYLFPDTYQFVRGVGAKRAFSVMVGQFKKHWQSLAEQAKERKMDMHQAVTLASIIEGEATAASERRIISAVYHNRLGLGMPLQADPTVAYGIEDLKGPLLRKHWKVDHPYNTYLHPGLPPGPICSPGLGSLKAAVDPAKVNYLYFVAKGDGTHVFNRHYRDHINAIKKYR